MVTVMVTLSVILAEARANDVYTLASAKITGNVTITVTIESTQVTPKTVSFD